MKIIAASLLVFASLMGSTSAVMLASGISIGTIAGTAEGNPTCVDWRYSFGLKMDGGCYNYQGPISGNPNFQTSGPAEEFSAQCDDSDIELGGDEVITVSCFTKTGAYFSGTGSCGDDCPYAIISVAADTDPIDVEAFSLKGGNGAILWLWSGTAALYATYDFVGAEIADIAERTDLQAYITSGLCDGGCTDCRSDCPGISHIDFCFNCGGVVVGDPHFLTWNGEYYDYMGECDLVLAESESFGDGLGMTAHIRTKGRYEYSYVESAAVKIGDDVLEVGGYGAYMFNGVSNAELPTMMADRYTLTKVYKNDHDVRFKIQEDGTDVITIKAFKDLVAVKFEDGFRPDVDNVHGLLGDKTGARYSRDHTHVIEDNNEFGQEWQVQPGVDPELFQIKSFVPYPTQCKLYNTVKDKRRRLGESISVEAATKACEKAGFSLKGALEACIYDVIAVGDLEAAEAGAF